MRDGRRHDGGRLWRHRSEDINIRGLARLPRNDMVANGVVMLVAGSVALTGSAWPDIVTGLGIAALFGASAIEVIRMCGEGDRRDSLLEQAPWKRRPGNFPGVQIRLLSKRPSVRSTQDRWTGQKR